MKNEFGLALKKYRQQNKLSQEALAGILGTSKQVISRYETNQRTPKISTVQDYARRLELSLETLMGNQLSHAANIRPVPLYNQIPILGTIACGTLKEALEETEQFVSVEDIRADFALIADGDSMIGARIHHGDIVLCKEQPVVEQGEIAAIVIGEEATLKRFYQYGNIIVLRAENPDYDDIEIKMSEETEIHIIGKAIAFISEIT